MNQQEKIYITMRNAGRAGIAVGIVSIIVGLVTGILAIVYGAKLLFRKRDVII